MTIAETVSNGYDNKLATFFILVLLHADRKSLASPVRPKRKKKAPFSFVTTCGAGLEQLVADEISEQGGANAIVNPGAVSWEGSLEAGYRMCLWSRFASRVLLRIAAFDAPDPDTLYRQTGMIEWDEHFGADVPFAVFSTMAESAISHSKYAALRVKDAIADQFRLRAGRRPSVDTTQPGMRINLHLQGRQAILAVDLSGESLHRRGYRQATVEAPLKETLAAAIVHLAGLRHPFPSDGILLDPMCGSGTLLIEAAMMLGDCAPGLQRKSFGLLFWNRHDGRLWEKLVSEAVEREEEGLRKPWPRIIGYDADPRAVRAARQNVAAAGMEDKIEISHRQLADLTRPAEKGLMVVNPPYGERLADREEIRYLYRCLDRKASRELHGWRIGFFTGNPDLAESFHLHWSERYRLFNGSIKCRLLCGTMERSVEKAPDLPRLHQPASDAEGEEFARRLNANCRRLFPWAEREEISCFRLYDADLPDYPLALDLYDRWILATEHPPARGSDQRQAGHRFNAALRIVRKVLAFPHSRIFVRRIWTKTDRRGLKAQSDQARLFEVTEQRCRYLIGLVDDRGTGLPLARRSLRFLLGRAARGATFLNLFGGTGTSTVPVLVNNGPATTTVDPSATLLQRARANFALNGFGGPQHKTIREDCLQWLTQCRCRYSLILVNHPAPDGGTRAETSPRLRQDHHRLLRLAMQRLTRDGLLLFTVDDPPFCLAPSLETEFAVREITAQLAAPDFTSSGNRNRCWEFRHRQQGMKEEPSW